MDKVVFANLFEARTTAQVVRLLFSDQIDAQKSAPVVAHVAMSRADAEALRDLLVRMLPDE